MGAETGILAAVVAVTVILARVVEALVTRRNNRTNPGHGCRYDPEVMRLLMESLKEKQDATAKGLDDLEDAIRAENQSTRRVLHDFLDRQR